MRHWDESENRKDSGVEESSNSVILDNAALNTVKRAALPAFPDAFKAGEAIHRSTVGVAVLVRQLSRDGMKPLHPPPFSRSAVGAVAAQERPMKPSHGAVEPEEGLMPRCKGQRGFLRLARGMPGMVAGCEPSRHPCPVRRIQSQLLSASSEKQGLAMPMRFAALWILLALAGCAAAPAVPPLAPWPFGAQAEAAATAPAMPQRVASLKFLGALNLTREAGDVPFHFGGISGLDHDPRRGTWYLLSDDRSERAPARVYTARLDLDGSGLKSLRLDGDYITLLQRDGTPHPPRGAAGEAADPEALRLDPLTGMLTWASEGDFAKGLSPFVRHAGLAGRFMGEVPLPRNLGFDAAGDRVGRGNLTVEGLAYSADGRELWVAMESALVQDGPVAGIGQPALARVSRLARTGEVLAQYAYRVEPVPVAASGGRHRADNGISDVLCLGRAGQLLVVERAGREVAEGVFKFTVRLYLASAEGATDIQHTGSLQGASFTPMAKTLLLDMAASGMGEIDNIEAAAWGPRLPNGHATLVLVSDDNFSPHQTTQVHAFEVLEP